jgi:hypothetical protein
VVWDAGWLNRYDRYTFSYYKRGTGGLKHLSGVQVTELFKDRSGALWIGVDQFRDRLDPVADLALFTPNSSIML